MFRELLVAVDGSDESKEAASAAIELANDQEGSLHAIYVREMHPTYTNRGAMIIAQDKREDEERAYADQVLEELEVIAEEDGVPFQSHVKSGVPSFVITEFARDKDIDAIVTGIRGRTGLRERIVGSTTERILRDASVTVIAVR